MNIHYSYSIQILSSSDQKILIHWQGRNHQLLPFFDHLNMIALNFY